MVHAGLQPCLQEPGLFPKPYMEMPGSEPAGDCMQSRCPKAEHWPCSVQVLLSSIATFGVLSLPLFIPDIRAPKTMEQGNPSDSKTGIPFLDTVFDPENTGYISTEKFRSLLQRHGSELDPHKLEVLLALADNNSDGKICYQDFVNLTDLEVSP
ncbi:Rhomboid-related protein 3 [Varanus komodoensis]|nr:Rhomboid-related protein 3 [Varanus komodoensis]